MLVGEQSFVGTVSFPFQVMVDDVLVTEPFGIVFGSIVGIGPNVALVGHQFMTGVVNTVIYPRDDLLFGSSVGKLVFFVASGIEKEYTCLMASAAYFVACPVMSEPFG